MSIPEDNFSEIKQMPGARHTRPAWAYWNHGSM
jgi:hypothetical protein